jgi:hypothetical protein
MEKIVMAMMRAENALARMTSMGTSFSMLFSEFHHMSRKIS